MKFSLNKQNILPSQPGNTGDIKTDCVFAFWPTKMDDGTIIWLEFYHSIKKLITITKFSGYTNVTPNYTIYDDWKEILRKYIS